MATNPTAAQRLAHDEQLCDVTTCPAPEHEPCACCGKRDAGHGHFAQFCAQCAVLPYTGCHHGVVPR